MNKDLHTPYSTVSFQMVLSDLAKYSMTRIVVRSLCDSWASHYMWRLQCLWSCCDSPVSVILLWQSGVCDPVVTVRCLQSYCDSLVSVILLWQSGVCDPVVTVRCLWSCCDSPVSVILLWQSGVCDAVRVCMLVTFVDSSWSAVVFHHEHEWHVGEGGVGAITQRSSWQCVLCPVPTERWLIVFSHIDFVIETIRQVNTVMTVVNLICQPYYF